MITCEFHFHLALLEDVCSFFHLYIFGFNSIFKDKMEDNLLCKAVVSHGIYKS